MMIDLKTKYRLDVTSNKPYINIRLKLIIAIPQYFSYYYESNHRTLSNDQ